MIDGEDRDLFERSLRHATGSHTGAALDAALDELGWSDALSVDVETAVSLLFALQGQANVVSSALDRVLAHALGVGSASASATVVVPALGRGDAPGVRHDGWLTVDGLGTASVGERETAVVVAGDGDAHVTVEVALGPLARRTVEGMDPSLGLVEVKGAVDAGDVVAELGPVDWPAALALAQLALGHELVGTARRMLALAREHALDRVQFGRPIAGFQAVRHRLAETYLAIEAADAALSGAWVDRAPQTAAMAKAIAGRSARVASRHCQQVLAGIGFTTEHPFHLHAKRVWVLDQLLGASRTLTRQLGDDILRRGQLPALLPL
jgi:alkylation response protein AidB-like acyl-CoA dehydrogenase